MILICETITEEPEGGSAMIPVDTFVWLYTFLAQMDCGSKPPESVNSEITVNTLVEPPANFDSVSPAASTNVKGEVEKECSLCDMTSQDGLMVWPDIVPSEKSIHHKSAGSPSDEGLTSEYGVVAFTEPTSENSQSIKYQQIQAGSTEDISQYTSRTVVTVEPRAQESQMTGMQDGSSTDGSEDKDTISEKGQTNSEQVGVTYEADVSNLQKPSTEPINKSQSNNSEFSPNTDDEKKESSDETGENNLAETTFDKTQAGSEIKLVNEGINLPFTKSSVYNELTFKNETEGNNISFEQIKTDNSIGNMKDTETTSSSGHCIDKQSSLSLGSNKLFQTFTEEPEGSHITETLSKFDGSIILSDEPYWEHVPGIGPVIPEHQLTAVVEYMKYWAAKQEGMIMPRNIKHFLCPPLDAEIPADDVLVK